MIKMLLFATVAVVFIISLVDGASDSSCLFQAGYCTTSSGCRSGYYYQYGLCSGAKRCCVQRGSGGDSHCTIRNGLCIPKSYGICTGKMAYYESGLCSGAADRQCCLLQYKD
ncbi:uncharacterized protein [Littorina saxatilis]|uniref:Carboxypeptidase inhibitor n=1 Tax=Littorina saxatilis TaxID=31220 RepID=A0AAN9B2X0_9CAEN